jgi:ATP-dependent RNA helicase RhlE
MAIHGDRSQRQRQQALEAFRKGRCRVLVATDIAARGLDVQGITHVVNFDLPMTSDDYIHRIGRTGRANATGEAYTFVSPDEHRELAFLERELGKELPREEWEGAVALPVTPAIREGKHPYKKKSGYRHNRDHQPHRNDGRRRGPRRSGTHHDESKARGGEWGSRPPKKKRSARAGQEERRGRGPSGRGGRKEDRPQRDDNRFRRPGGRKKNPGAGRSRADRRRSARRD